MDDWSIGAIKIACVWVTMVGNAPQLWRWLLGWEQFSSSFDNMRQWRSMCVKEKKKEKTFCMCHEERNGAHGMYTSGLYWQREQWARHFVFFTWAQTPWHQWPWGARHELFGRLNNKSPLQSIVNCLQERESYSIQVPENYCWNKPHQRGLHSG